MGDSKKHCLPDTTELMQYGLCSSAYETYTGSGQTGCQHLEGRNGHRVPPLTKKLSVLTPTYKERSVFSSGILLGVSTRGNPVSRSTWPAQNKLSGTFVKFLFHFCFVWPLCFCLTSLCFDFLFCGVSFGGSNFLGFVSCFFVCSFWFGLFIRGRGRKNTELVGYGYGKDLGEMGGGGSKIKIYCVKKKKNLKKRKREPRKLF